jgi:predicted deacylase
VANPPGLAQVVLNGGIGRFDLASGRNFNRDFPDLAPLRSGISADCLLP